MIFYIMSSASPPIYHVDSSCGTLKVLMVGGSAIIGSRSIDLVILVGKNTTNSTTDFISVRVVRVEECPSLITHGWVFFLEGSLQ